MAGFLRKKSKIESPVKTKSQSARPIEPTTDNPPLTPLFARYATGQVNEGGSQKKLVVSSPMTLSSRRESTSPTKRNVSAGQSMQYGVIGREGNGIAGMSSSHEREKAARMSRSVSAQSPGGVQNGPSPMPSLSPPSSNIEKPLPQIISVEPSQFLPSNRVQNVAPSTASPIMTPRKNSGLVDPEPRPINVKPSSTPNSLSPVNRNSTVRAVVTPHNPDKTGNKDTIHISHKSSAKDLRHKQTDMIQSNNNNGFHDHTSPSSSLTPLSECRDQSTVNDITSTDDFNTWLHSQSLVDAPISPDTQGVFSSAPSKESSQPISASYETIGSPQPTSDLPFRGKPLIFSAMASVNSEPPPPPPPPPIKPSTNISGPHQADISKSYPSPPSEHTPFQSQRNLPQAHIQSPYLQSPHSRPDSDSPRRQSLVSSRSRPPTASNTSENPPPPLYKTPSQVSPQRVRKTSLTGRPIEASSPRTLTKPRPTTPTKRPTTPKHRPLTPVSPDGVKRKAEVSMDLNNGGILSGAFVDDDPFAKVPGVKMLQPSSVSRDDDVSRGHSPPQGPESNPQSILPSIPSDSSRNALIQQNDPDPASDVSQLTGPSTGQSSIEEPQENVSEEQVVNNETNHIITSPPPSSVPIDGASPSPSSTERYRNARNKRRGDHLAKEVPTEVKHLPLKEDRPAEPFPLPLFLAEPALLSSLLSYLCFYEWCTLLSLSKGVRSALLETPQLKEAVLERFLDTVGYSRWTWSDPEPLTLTIEDLHNYMRGVSLPTHEYARVSELVLKAKSGHSSQIDDSVWENAQQMIQCTRAYNRVLLRLRAQAEKESTNPSPTSPSSFREPGRSGRMYPGSQPSSRAPSPTRSSHSHGNTQNQPPLLPSSAGRSPLFRLRRAPLLRVFVPSPEGDWLSDDSVLECEAELDCAGIRNLIHFGDVVWDIAVGDEGNVGRMIWDGKYLIDLDYTYSTVGDLPKYIPALAFPPSYFHRVIRTGPASSNPVVRMDLTPWGMEIASNLQLLQDRVRTETPQGAYHNVVRWVHRSSFVIRPPASGSSHSHGKRSTSRSRPNRIPIPDSNHLFVDPGWYGTIVVETEGTNESLADLQERCGPGAFPPRAAGAASASTPSGKEREKDSKLVYRIIRERSRPGEIWIRATSAKERLM